MCHITRTCDAGFLRMTSVKVDFSCAWSRGCTEPVWTNIQVSWRVLVYNPIQNVIEMCLIFSKMKQTDRRLLPSLCIYFRPRMHIPFICYPIWVAELSFVMRRHTGLLSKRNLVGYMSICCEFGVLHPCTGDLKSVYYVRCITPIYRWRELLLSLVISVTSSEATRVLLLLVTFLRRLQAMQCSVACDGFAPYTGDAGSCCCWKLLYKNRKMSFSFE